MQLFRYGLPVNFQAILIHPNKKSVKRLRDVLNQLYSHLDGSASAPSSNSDVSAIFTKLVLTAWNAEENIIEFPFLFTFAECRYSGTRIWSVGILSIRLLQTQHRYGRIEIVNWTTPHPSACPFPTMQWNGKNRK